MAENRWQEAPRGRPGAGVMTGQVEHRHRETLRTALTAALVVLTLVAALSGCAARPGELGWQIDVRGQCEGLVRGKIGEAQFSDQHETETPGAGEDSTNYVATGRAEVVEESFSYRCVGTFMNRTLTMELVELE